MTKAKFHKNNYIDRIDVKELKESEFQRICLHKSETSQLHSMLIYKDSTDISRIHKHPNKEEVFLILEGMMNITTYDSDLNKIKTIIMEPYDKNGIFAYMIPAGMWHETVVVTDLVYMEFVIGPFNREETIWL